MLDISFTEYQNMKPEEIAAYIGAAAWLQPIAFLIYKMAMKSRLRVIPNQSAQVGFTAYGPIFNVNMVFLVENRDLIIDGLELNVRHENGESRNFRWSGIAETFSEISDSAGNKQIVSKDQSPIAIKVLVQGLIEKFVRFQEPSFHLADSVTTKALVTHFNFVKQRSPNTFASEVLDSKEYSNVIKGRQNWFPWKPGRYTLELNPTSPQRFKLLDSTYTFELTQNDVELLQKNLTVVEADLNNLISSNIPNFTAMPVDWKWAEVAIHIIKNS
jgi:hypothetical protein